MQNRAAPRVGQSGLEEQSGYSGILAWDLETWSRQHQEGVGTTREFL